MAPAVGCTVYGCLDMVVMSNGFTSAIDRGNQGSCSCGFVYAKFLNSAKNMGEEDYFAVLLVI